MKIKTKRRLLILGIFVGAFLLFGLLSMKPPEQPKKPIVQQAMLVETINLTTENVRFIINSQGTIKPRTQTKISAEVSGQIIAISDSFIPGGVFKAGEILLKIDDTDYQVAVEQAQALVKQRNLEYQGAKSLSTKGFRADAELASSEAALAAAKASLVKAKKNLERTNIRLPYSGMVASKLADLGQFVNPGTQLGATFAIDQAEVRLALTDQDLAFLNLPKASFEQTKQTINPHSQNQQLPKVILTGTYQGQIQHWPATLVRTEGVIDESSRMTFAVAAIDNPYSIIDSTDEVDRAPLPMGTFVSADIEGIEFPNLIRVPRTAIRGKDQLMLLDAENRLEIETIQLVRADQEYAYINNPELSGKKLIITSLEAPINGMQLRTLDTLIESDTAASSVSTNDTNVSN